MTRELSRRERKKHETRQRLLEEALQLFREHGYDATTVEQIAAAADVAKGTFFNYFETKEAILQAIAEQRLRQLEQALLLEGGAPASPVARIKLGLTLVAKDFIDNQLLVQELLTTALHLHRPPLRPPSNSNVRDLLADLVAEAQAAGEIRADVNPIQLSGAIGALFFQQIMAWCCNDQSIPLGETLDQVVDLLLEGIAGPQWSA